MNKANLQPLSTENQLYQLHTLLYRCFRICSDWSKIDLELIKIMDVFKSNGYSDNFINHCFLDKKQNKKK